jgi:hypothetical protein
MLLSEELDEMLDGHSSLDGDGDLLPVPSINCI